MPTTKTYDSPDGLLRLLVIRADNGDVSLGFDNCAWHTHGDVLAATYGVGAETAIARFMDDLMGNRVVIAVTRRGGVVADTWVTDDPHGDLRYKPDAMLGFMPLR